MSALKGRANRVRASVRRAKPNVHTCTQHDLLPAEEHDAAFDPLGRDHRQGRLSGCTLSLPCHDESSRGAT